MKTCLNYPGVVYDPELDGCRPDTIQGITFPCLDEEGSHYSHYDFGQKRCKVDQKWEIQACPVGMVNVPYYPGCWFSPDSNWAQIASDNQALLNQVSQATAAQGFGATGTMPKASTVLGCSNKEFVLGNSCVSRAAAIGVGVAMAAAFGTAIYFALVPRRAY